jgi:hypothetical protein
MVTHGAFVLGSARGVRRQWLRLADAAYQIDSPFE